MPLTTDVTLQTDPNTIVNTFMKDFASFLEVTIKTKWESLQLFKKMLERDPDSTMARQQVDTLTQDLQVTIKQLLELRKESEFMMSDTKQIISSEGFCSDCGERKKKKPYESIKISQEQAQYRETADPMFNCGHCRWFNPEQETCQVVEGIITLGHVSNRFEPHENIESFSINEKLINEQLIAFTHSSSWIGNVRYNTESKTMRILMNGEAYTHCGVERIDYDAFEGAPSKGEHWWRNIKDQFNC